MACLEGGRHLFSQRTAPLPEPFSPSMMVVAPDLQQRAIAVLKHARPQFSQTPPANVHIIAHVLDCGVLYDLFKAEYPTAVVETQSEVPSMREILEIGGPAVNAQTKVLVYIDFDMERFPITPAQLSIMRRFWMDKYLSVVMASKQAYPTLHFETTFFKNINVVILANGCSQPELDETWYTTFFRSQSSIPTLNDFQQKLHSPSEKGVVLIRSMKSSFVCIISL